MPMPLATVPSWPGHCKVAGAHWGFSPWGFRASAGACGLDAGRQATAGGAETERLPEDPPEHEAARVDVLVFP